MIKRDLSHWLYIAPVLIVLTLIFIYPLSYNFWLSLHEKVLGRPPRFAGFKNYLRLFHSRILYISLLRTFVYAFGAVAIKTLIGLGVALLLNQKFKGRGVLRGLSIMPWAMPAYVCAVLYWFNYAGRGTFNRILTALGLQPVHWLGYDWAMFSVILINVWHGWPFFFMGILAGLQALPAELYESADIDGANFLQKFLYITLPLLRPVILTVVLLSLMWTMGDFTIIYMTTGGGPIDRTLTAPMAAFKIAFLSEANIPLAATYTIVILPIYLVLMYFTLKYMG